MFVVYIGKFLLHFKSIYCSLLINISICFCQAAVIQLPMVLQNLSSGLYIGLEHFFGLQATFKMTKSKRSTYIQMLNIYLFIYIY